MAGDPATQDAPWHSLHDHNTRGGADARVRRNVVTPTHFSHLARDIGQELRVAKDKAPRRRLGKREVYFPSFAGHSE